MSDADRVGMAYIVESSYGVFPTSNPVIRNIRYTSESLTHAKNLARSSEIRSDRQRDALLRLSAQGAGDIAFELAPQAYEDFMEWGIQADASWVASSEIISAQSDVAVATTSGGQFTSATTDKFNSFAIGDLILTEGFSNDENNGFFYVTSVVTGSSPILGVSSLGTTTLVTEAASESVTMTRLSAIKNGVLQKSFAIEKEFDDVANVFQQFLGCAIDSFAITAETDSIVTSSISILSAGAVTVTATSGSGTNGPAIPAAYTATADPFSVVADLSSVIFGLAGDHAESKALGWSLQVGNNIRNKLKVGSVKPFEQGSGQIVVTGTVRLYFAGKVIYDAFLADDYFTAMFVLQQDVVTDPYTYIFAMPKCKLQAAPIQVGGSNQDMIVDASFEAIRDPIEGYTIKIARLGSNVT